MDTMTIAPLSRSSPAEFDVRLTISEFRLQNVVMADCSQNYTTGRSAITLFVCSRILTMSYIA